MIEMSLVFKVQKNKRYVGSHFPKMPVEKMSHHITLYEKDGIH